MFEIGGSEVDVLIPKTMVPICEPGTIPNLDGFEEIPGYAVAAYYGGPSRRLTEDRARRDAIMMAAVNFRVDIGEILRSYNVVIVPGNGYHGRIMAKRKN